MDSILEKTFGSTRIDERIQVGKPKACSHRYWQRSKVNVNMYMRISSGHVQNSCILVLLESFCDRFLGLKAKLAALERTLKVKPVELQPISNTMDSVLLSHGTVNCFGQEGEIQNFSLFFLHLSSHCDATAPP